MITTTPPLVQLHYASLDLLNDKSFLAQVLGWLSSEERKRYKRFVDKQQANQYLLARALLRRQLSKQVPGVLPQKWVFVIDDSGKPRLADEFSYLNIRFNLSHSEDLVVLALGDGLGGRLNLGIDVECIHRPVFSIALAKHYFAETELVDLMKLDEQQRIKRIAQLWTLKESYLKARGLGIRMPLAKLKFFFEGECGLGLSISSSWTEPLPVEDRSFISLFSLGTDYSLALTIESDKPMDTSAMTIDEWTGLSTPLLGLPCELLRKTMS
jgi:4'-phosphopantetheinyl transferase